MQREVKEDDVLSHPQQAALGTAAPDMPVTALSDSAESRDLLQHVISSLEDDKAEELVQIDLRGKSEIADYMVICSGRSSRQVNAISEKLTDRLKQDHGILCKIEGQETGDWVLIDAGDVIVHVFRPEVRAFYQLEKMWLPAGAATAEG